MTKITIADILGWGPCDGYDEARLRQLLRGRESLTPLEVLALRIPYGDRLWAVLREEVLPASLLHDFACRCGQRALRRERNAGREPDPKSWAAIKAKRAWLRGDVDDGQLDAAGDDARAAARAAAGDAAGAAAWAAAWDAAGAAARDAAGAAVWAAAGAAAGDVERKWQCAALRKMIREGGKT